MNLPAFLSVITGLFVAGLLRAENAPTAAQIELAAPKDYQVFQRADLAHGAITVEGKWSVPRQATVLPDSLEARVLGSGVTAESEDGWMKMPFDSRARGFRGELPVQPGGWYSVQVRLLRAGQELARVDVGHVGLGEVFLIAGQSNSANYGEARQQPASGLVAAYDGERWGIANDPQPGATGTKGSFIPSFGDAMARKLQVPIGVICIGVGSTSVREWLPAGHPMSAPPTTGAHCVALDGGTLVSSGELFARLAERLRQFYPRGLRAVLWHQGESDWHQPDGHSLPLVEFRNDLAELINLSRTASGWDVPWFVAQVSYGNPSNPGSAEFRAQQLAVVDERLTFRGPNTDVLTSEFREKNGQGVHFNEAGLKKHGELWAEIVSRWIEEQARANPNIRQVTQRTQSSDTEVHREYDGIPAKGNEGHGS